jgi:hypothetical protein
MGADTAEYDGQFDEYWNVDRGVVRRIVSRCTDLSDDSTADWFGRRRSLSLGVIVFIIGNIIQITAMNSWVHMMMGRFVAGLGVVRHHTLPPVPD